jgi:hypothetical protein
MDQNDLVLFQMMAIMASYTNDLFNSHEMEDAWGQFVDPTVGVRYVLGTMQATSTLFKTLTNFTLEEFDKLASEVVPTIIAHVTSTCEFHLSYFMFSILIFGA